MQSKRECLYSLDKNDVSMIVTIKFYSIDTGKFEEDIIPDVTSVKKTKEGLVVNSIDDGITKRHFYPWYSVPGYMGCDLCIAFKPCFVDYLVSRLIDSETKEAFPYE